jgi:hypothetical protein
MLKPLHIAGILILSALAGAATIVTTRGAAKVYPNPIRRVFEQPLFVLDKGEVVEVLEWQKPLTKIRNRKGRVGYVDIALLDSLKRPPILRLVIDSEPTPVKVAPAPAPKATAKPVADTVKKAVEATAVPVIDSTKKVAPASQPAEKPVDFRKDSTHIQPRSNADTTKH